VHVRPPSHQSAERPLSCCQKRRCACRACSLVIRVGELVVEWAGKVGDVAQGGGLAGPLGERVLLETVLRCLLGDGNSSVQQLLGRYEVVHHAQFVRLVGGEDLSEETASGCERLAPGVGEHADAICHQERYLGGLAARGPQERHLRVVASVSQPDYGGHY
jgi:hypothetical protein